MKKALLPVLLAGATLTTGCLEEKKTAVATAESQPTVKKEDAVAVVNGKYIGKKTLETLENEISMRSRGQQFPKDKLIEELIQRELLVQDAIQKQLDKSPEFIERMNTVKSSLLSQAALQNFLKSNPISEAQLKAEYDKKMGAVGTEYKARHILLKTEEEAKAVIEELNNGADFVELAKAKSTGPSGPQGGDLGWFAPDRMVPPFSEAVIALENGKVSAEPVKTQFGYHVILREDAREQTPPPFEAVKEQIKPVLQREVVQQLMENLRKQAKVEILYKEPAKPAPTIEPISDAELKKIEGAIKSKVEEANAAKEAVEQQ